MGNSVSSKTEEGSSFATHEVSRVELHREVFAELKRKSNPIDLIQLSRNLPFTETGRLSSTVSRTELFHALNIKKHEGFLWKLLKVVAKFPQFSTLNDTDDSISMRDLITCLVILQGGLKHLKVQMGLVEFVWLAMVDQDCVLSTAEDMDGTIDTIDDSHGRVQWAMLPIVQSMDGVEMRDVSREAFTHMVAEIIPLFAIEGGGELVSSDELNEVNFNATITSIVNGYVHGEDISYDRFKTLLNKLTPRLFDPLQVLLTPLTQIEILKGTNTLPEGHGKLLTTPMFCHLNAIREVNGDVETLFSGTENGFSMRALESHIFKYRAPTLMLIRGRVQTGFDKYKSPLFKTFPSTNACRAFKSVTLGIHVNVPWKVCADGATFGEESEVYELQPKTGVTRSVGGCYFSQQGVGVGASASPRVSKVKNTGAKFGDISIGAVTIDNALEYGNFRNTCGEDVWFKVLELEVVGLGSGEERKEQRKQWAWEKQEADRRKYISSVEDSRALLEMAGLVGNANASGGSI